MQDQQLIDYIKQQIQSGFTTDAIVKALLDAGYTQPVIDQAFDVINAPVGAAPSKKNKIPNTVYLLIFVGGLSVAALFAFAAFQIQNPSASPSPQASVQPTPNLSAECGTFYDVGYLKGLADTDISDNSLLSRPIPPQCQSTHDFGYQEGVASREEQLAQNYDTQRRSDLLAISNALYTYAADNDGNLPPGINENPKELGTEAGKLNISSYISRYISQDFPYDPEDGSPESTKYSVYESQQGYIQLEAKSSINPNQKIVVRR